MERILFITSTRIGDAVLSSGLLAHLARTRPQARFTVAAGPLAAPLFAAAERVDQVIAMPKQASGGHWLALWRAVAARRWSQVVDLRGSRTSWFLRADRRIIAHSSKERCHKVAEAARVLNLSAPADPVIWTSPQDQAAAAETLPPGGPVLAVSASASAPFKEWPAERFAEMAQRLTGEGGPLAGARVAAFGGPGDETTAAAALALTSPERAINLAGRLSLPQTAACLERAALFVGNDSGLMHISAASGAPTLGLFGPTDERVYGPWGPRTAAVRAGGYIDAAARATLRHESETLMAELTVDTVCVAAQSLLGPIPLEPQSPLSPSPS